MSTQPFSVTTPDKELTLTSPLLEFPVTVTNEGTVADRVDLEMQPAPTASRPAIAGWFSWKGHPLPALESLDAGAAVTFTVALTLPDPPPPNGTYGFRPLVYSAVRSHAETLTPGPDMTVEVRLRVEPPTPWWRRYRWAIALAVVAVVAAVVAVVVGHSGGSGGTTYPAGGQTVVTDVSSPIGSSFDAAHHRLVAVEFGGRLLAVDPATRATTTLGTGYRSLEDVQVLPGGDLVVTERTGDILRLPGSGGPRPGATVIGGGLSEPQQLALTRDGRQLFVVEYSGAGRLLRYDLSGPTVPAPVVVATGLRNAVGLAVSADGSTAYVSEQATQTLTAIPVAGGTRRVVATGLPSAFFLSWADAARTALLIAERRPANAVVRVPVSGGAATQVVAGAPDNASSVAPIGDRNVAVVGDREIRAYTLP